MKEGSTRSIPRTTLSRMAMGKRRRRLKQAAMWVATQDLPRSAAHPFYTRLNQILDKHDLDGYVEGLCQRFYAEVRTYISEPDRGRRNWTKNPEARAAVYRNRRRIWGARGQRLLRRRGERLERPFAHLYETGGMRRVFCVGTPTFASGC